MWVVVRVELERSTDASVYLAGADWDHDAFVGVGDRLVSAGECSSDVDAVLV